MPLNDGYGVVIGTLDHYQRDPVNNYGQYYHENIYVNTPAGVYHCAVDVDSKMTNDGIEWRVVPLSEADLKGVATLNNGAGTISPQIIPTVRSITSAQLRFTAPDAASSSSDTIRCSRCCAAGLISLRIRPGVQGRA